MRQAIKRTLARFAPLQSTPGLRILLYHNVDEPDSADHLSLRVSPDNFQSQMEFLHREGYRVVGLRSLIHGDGLENLPCIAITFDDGYSSQLHSAEILKQFNFPATFFVATRYLDGEKSGAFYWEEWDHMDWLELASLAKHGDFEIGAHSASHLDLTRCSGRQLTEEIGGAKRLLEQRLAQEVLSFSYPHGAYNDRVLEAVKKAGYRLACTSICGANEPPWPWHELRRIEITGRDQLGDFRDKLMGRYDWLGQLSCFKRKLGV